MKDRGKRLSPLCAMLIVTAGLLGLAGCDDSNVLNPSGGGTGGGAADIDVTSATPASGNTNISGSSITVTSSFENSGATTRVQVDATSDGYLRQVLVYFTTSSGAVENVSYFWGISSLLEHIVYCPAAGCSGTSVNLTTREITFSSAPLDNHGNPGPTDPATEFATLSLGMIQYPNP